MRSLVFNGARKLSKLAPTLCRLQSNFSKPAIEGRNFGNQMPNRGSKFQGNVEMLRNLDREGLAKLEPWKLGVLLNAACRANDLEAGMKVFYAMKPPKERDISQYAMLLGKHARSANEVGVRHELDGIWSKAVACGCDGDEKFISSLLKALSFSKSYQRKIIHQVISKAPSQSYDCRILISFLKYCVSSNDKEFARAVWEWGKSIREREFGSEFYFSACFRYYSLLDTSATELNALWNQIVECCQDDSSILVTAMCSALSMEPDHEKQFIEQVISKPPSLKFDCILLGTFLAPCENNLPLAQRIWSWGSNIRERERGREGLEFTFINYLGICSKYGDVDLVESVWKEAEQLEVSQVHHAMHAYVNALASVKATDRLISFVENVGIGSLNNRLLTTILKSFSNAGECAKALELLRRVQRENSSGVSMISYNVVINGLCQSKNFDAALSLVEEAKSLGHVPDCITWISILNMCKKHMNLPIAALAFEEIRRIESDKYQLAKAYTMMTDVCYACGDEEKAAEIEEERNNGGLVLGRCRVDLDLEGSRKVSFFNQLQPKNLGPEDSDKITLQLNEWTSLLESRGISAEPTKFRYAEMLALAYAVAVHNMKQVTIRKAFQISESSHEANRVLGGILGIKIIHWDNFGRKDDPALVHAMVDGKCSCKMRQCLR